MAIAGSANKEFQQSNKNSVDKDIPLVVDLDGTLIKTDLPWECFIFVLSHFPIQLIKIFWRKWKVKSQGYFKIELEKWSRFSLNQLPFSKNFLEYLKAQKAKGRSLILCTGSLQSYADRISKIVGLFDSAWGSQLGNNIVGSKKAEFLVNKYGEKRFDYAGNSSADFFVAEKARRFILVHPSLWVLHRSKKWNVDRLFLESKVPVFLLLHNFGFFLWSVNILFFLSGLLWMRSFISADLLFISFLHFSFLTWAFHTFFTLICIHKDRIHNKKNNLFALGDVSISFACAVSGLFLISSIVSGLYLGFHSFFSLISSLLYVFAVYHLICKINILLSWFLILGSLFLHILFMSDFLSVL